MTRRGLLLAAAAGASGATPSRVTLPLNRVTDAHAHIPPDVHSRFWWKVWPEAVSAFYRGGVEIQCTDTQGAVKHTPADRPILEGLDRSKLNLMLTDRVPMLWDQARGLAGVTTLYEGCAVSLISMQHAHGYRVPFVDTNTVVHEMLHAILGDIFIRKPTGLQVNKRELSADAYATRLWMFGDAAAVRRGVVKLRERLTVARERY